MRSFGIRSRCFAPAAEDGLHRAHVARSSRFPAEVGSPEDLYYRPRTEFTATFLGGGNVVVGREEQGTIRLGGSKLPFPPGSPEHEAGTPVRILFRSETVCFRSDPFAETEGVYAIGKGRLIERTFAGAVERLRFELQTLQGTRPVTPAVKYGEHYAAVVATRPSAGTADRPEPGEERWIGLPSFHVLDPSNLRFLLWVDDYGYYKALISGAQQLARASHGTLTLLQITAAAGDPDANRRTVERLAAAAAADGEIHVIPLSRQGDITAELIAEIQHTLPDVLFLGRPENRDERLERRFTVLTRRLLVSLGTPVCVGLKPIEQIRRVLICTVGGKPGETVVRFGARLARHIAVPTTVLHVLDPEADEHETARIERHLANACSLLNLYNIPNGRRVESGLPLPGILGEAERGGYDLLVVGASGAPDGVKPEDSLIARLIRQTDRAVLIVPSLE